MRGARVFDRPGHAARSDGAQAQAGDQCGIVQARPAGERNRRPMAMAAITPAQARTVAGSGAGTWSIVPPVGE